MNLEAEGPFMEMLIQDARYAVRSLRRTPAFTAAALVTLMLGIGATAAIFTVINATLLRPLPYPDPDRLMQVMRRYPTGTERGQTGRRYLFFRDHLTSVSALAAWRGPTGVNLALGDRAEYVKAMSVSKEFFDVFGVLPVAGRPFTAEEDTDGGPDAAILSYSLWVRQLGGDPGAIGRPISLGGRSYTVVGVLPASFVFSPSSDLLVPLRPGLGGPGGGFNYIVAGRLKLERLRRIPGVSSAAVVNGVPIEQGLTLNVDVLDGPEDIKDALTDWRYASTDYFRTMGITLAAGRGFEDRDREGAPPVAVVNEEFARRFFKGAGALGRHIRVFDSDGSIEIVGIAKNVREQGLVGSLPAVMFVPIAQANPSGVRASHTYFPMSWVVRTTDASGVTVARIRDAIRALDPQQPFSAFRTMEEVKLAQLTSERFEMALFAAFAAIGLALAAAGIYGLVSYAVSQRTRELGIRMALGATRHGIIMSVVASSATLALAGVAAGAGAALAFTRTLRTVVWGIGTGDPATFIGVAAILLLVAILSSLIPALRAVRLDPASALRE